MSRRVTSFHSRRADERPLTPRIVAIVSGLYCSVSLAIGFVDQRFLLMAWVMAGFLGMSLYFAFDRRLPLVNPATLFFSATVLGCLCGFALG